MTNHASEDGEAVSVSQSPPKNIGLVRLEGDIAAGGQIEYFKSNTLLEAAFSHPQIDVVALYINSPGGSPSQSEMVGGRIAQLAKKFNKPVYAFVGDSAASGGYWIACGADEIYVNRTSVVGSIGVVTEHTNVHEKMKKDGVKKKIMTAGSKKRTASPYEPFNDEALAPIQARLNKLHDEFIDWVMKRRGDQLKKAGSIAKRVKLSTNDVFSGDTWIGDDAVKMGLADGIGTLSSVLDEKCPMGYNILEFAYSQGHGGHNHRMDGDRPSNAQARKAANDDHGIHVRAHRITPPKISIPR